VPPYSLVKKLTQEQYVNVLILEGLANEGVVPTRIQALWEVDCAAETMRTLSVTTYASSGAPSSNEHPGEWSQVAPQTTGDILTKTLCKK
jgi:hypothetical protein